MEKKTRNKLLLILAVLVLLALSCSEVIVQNDTASPVRVIVAMPGESSPETTVILAGDAEIFLSDISGTYTITAVLDEAWRDNLRATRDEITLILLGNLNTIDQEEISRLTRALGKINDLLDKDLNPISCSGEVNDEVSGNVTIGIHLSGVGLAIRCD
jgi:hypothetical protein